MVTTKKVLKDFQGEIDVTSQQSMTESGNEEVWSDDSDDLINQKSSSQSLTRNENKMRSNCVSRKLW